MNLILKAGPDSVFTSLKFIGTPIQHYYSNPRSLYINKTTWNNLSSSDVFLSENIFECNVINHHLGQGVNCFEIECLYLSIFNFSQTCSFDSRGQYFSSDLSMSCLVPSNCQKQRWPSSTTPYGVTTLQWNNQTKENSSNTISYNVLYHNDVIKWKYFSRYWSFVRGIHRSPVNSPHKGQWRGAFMFSLICVWINAWVNNREAGDLRRHRAHYDVTVMHNSYTIVRPSPNNNPLHMINRHNSILFYKFPVADRVSRRSAVRSGILIFLPWPLLLDN